MSNAMGTVGIVSSGDMGAAVARVLAHGGLKVVTCQTGRSERTRRLGREAGIEGLPTMDDVVRASDVFLSLVPPSSAVEMANSVAESVSRVEKSGLLFADGNSIAPQTMAELGALLPSGRVEVVDMAIIGQPPKVGQTPGGGAPRFYVSGDRGGELLGWRAFGLDVRLLRGPVGQASGLKMCYASLLKGLTAVSTQLLVAGELLGLHEPLFAELETAQPVLLEMMRRQLPGMPPKAYRWVGEMEEIAKTFASVGLPPDTFTGAARLFDLVRRTDLGGELPEERRIGTSLSEVVDVLAEYLRPQALAKAAPGSL